MAESPKMWTVQSVLEWSTGFLQRNEIDAPRLTAELLLAHVLGVTRLDLYRRFEQPLIESELTQYRESLQRRRKHEPTQYILGNQPFWDLTLQVDRRVLIPRPETECIIEEALQLFKQGLLPIQGPFLDLCTGSGALACALAVEFPEASIDATDISKDALEVAAKNVETHELSARISLSHGDLFAPLAPKQYSLIVSNPPYIRSDEMPGLQKEVGLFEPALALDGGEDGLDIVRNILAQASDFLTAEGFLLIEIGAAQGDEARAAAAETGAFAQIDILKDYSKRDRILKCCKANRSV